MSSEIEAFKLLSVRRYTWNMLKMAHDLSGCAGGYYITALHGKTGIFHYIKISQDSKTVTDSLSADQEDDTDMILPVEEFVKRYGERARWYVDKRDFD